MAKTKAELLDEAKKLGIEVDAKAKVADIQALIEKASSQPVIPSNVEESVEEQEQISPQGRDDKGEGSDDKEVKATAKVGKRSEKGIKEAEEKVAKTEAQHHREELEAEKTEIPKKVVKPARSRLERRGKGFKMSAELIEKRKLYDLKSAVELAKKTSHVKFDATVELHVNLAVDPRHADQNIRDNVVLPAGTGKTVRVAVADDALLEKLEKGTVDFDVLIATPEFMPKLGKYARVLGPKGLMPNPKSGTVTTDVDKAVAEAKAGRVEYRVDSTGIVHIGVGKVSFTPEQLLKNTEAILTSIKSAKPNSVKGNYIKAVYLTTSMGPSITVDAASVS